MHGAHVAGDGITRDNTDRVWIDHNRFTRIGRQMIVSGWGKASNVTISNNDFDGTSAYSSYCNGTHYWNVLLVGADDSITLAGNWFRNYSGRAPKVGTADGKSTVQIVNNLFENGSWHAIDSSEPARLLIEGNYFRNVGVPILKGGSAGYVYAPLAGAPTSATTACGAVLGRDCVANTADPTPQANGFTLDSTVLDAARQLPSGAIIAPYAASLVPSRVPAQAGPQATLP